MDFYTLALQVNLNEHDILHNIGLKDCFFNISGDQLPIFKLLEMSMTWKK